MHHIVSDGWSVGVFDQEIATAYARHAAGAAAAPAPPNLPFQYGDFALWQRESFQGARFEEDLAFWQRLLAGAPELLELATDRPRPPAARYVGDAIAFDLTPRELAALRAFAEAEGATLFMVLLAGYAALLHRYTGSTDVVIGTPTANRMREGAERLIGYFVNTLPLRVDLAGTPSLRELVRRAKDLALSVYAHEHVPFERIVEAVRPKRSLSYAPIFQTMLVLQNARGGGEEIPLSNGTSKFDQSWVFLEDDAGLHGAIEYSADLFDAETVTRMTRHFRALVAGALQRPDAPIESIPLLTPEEEQDLAAWNRTDHASDVPPTFLDIVDAHTRANPTATAVEAPEGSLTYAELDARAGSRRGLS
jgi:non-ribosomal peptide synthetase component F